MLPKISFLLLLCLATMPILNAHAEKFISENQKFSIEPSEEWMPLSLDYANVVVHYGKKGTLATFHISAREFEEAKTLEMLKWEDLFSPEFNSIDIHTQGQTMIGGEKARYCVYSLKSGPFKSKMEGKLPGKYMNYVMIHNGRLFSITFKDTAEGFSVDYPSFMKAIRTFQFNELPPPISGGTHDISRTS